MLKILKAEICYYRNLFLFLYGFVAIFLAANIMVGDLEDHLLWLSFVTLPIIGSVVSNEEKKTGRIRLYTRLPVALRHIGLSRYPVLLTYWFSLVLLVCLSSWISRPFGSIAPSPWEILSFAAAGPFLAAGMTIHLDLKFCPVSPLKKLTFRSLLALLAVIFIVFYFASYLTTATRSFDFQPFLIFQFPSVAVILSCLTLGFLILSIFIFEQRLSYRE